MQILPRQIVCYNPHGRPVGRLVRDPGGRLWLEKTGLDPAKHQLRQPPAWATDADHLALLREHGGHGVRLVTVDGTTWEAPLAAFDRHGLELDRGFGKQVALPLRWWTAHQPGTRQLALPLEVAS